MTDRRPGRDALDTLVSVLRGLSGSVRRAVALALVAALSVPLVLASDRVAIAVDGRVVEVETYGDTVAEVLAAAGVALGPDDVVHPTLRTDVVDGLAVEVVRAVPVALRFEGRVHVLSVAGETVGDVLVAAGIGDVRGLSIQPAPSTLLSQSRRVEVTEATTVRVHVDGAVHRVRVTRGTLADALALARVTVRPSDQLSLPAATELDGGELVVTLTRHDQQEVLVEVTLPFHEHVIRTADRFEGEQVVTQEGSEGLRHDVYRVDLVDGVEVGRTLVSETVVTPAVDRTVEVGTKPKPAPPPPAPSNAGDDSVWDRLARCESGGNWQASGTYHGGLQFHPDTWNAWKPSGYPAFAYEASREQQIEVGKRLHAARGWAPWPACARQLGLM